MQRTLLVTVQGPRRAVDVELPGDVLTGELFPLLQEMCGSAPSPPHGELTAAFWSLSLAGSGKLLAAALTLFDNGVLDGDVLLLQEGSLLPVPAAPARPGIPEMIVPSERTGGIGVTWQKV